MALLLLAIMIWLPYSWLLHRRYAAKLRQCDDPSLLVTPVDLWKALRLDFPGPVRRSPWLLLIPLVIIELVVWLFYQHSPIIDRMALRSLALYLMAGGLCESSRLSAGLWLLFPYRNSIWPFAIWVGIALVGGIVYHIFAGVLSWFITYISYGDVATAPWSGLHAGIVLAISLNVVVRVIGVLLPKRFSTNFREIRH